MVKGIVLTAPCPECGGLMVSGQSFCPNFLNHGGDA